MLSAAFDNSALYFFAPYPRTLVMKNSLTFPLTPPTAAVHAAIFLFAFALLASIAFGIVR